MVNDEVIYNLGIISRVKGGLLGHGWVVVSLDKDHGCLDVGHDGGQSGVVGHARVEEGLVLRA